VLAHVNDSLSMYHPPAGPSDSTGVDELVGVAVDFGVQLDKEVQSCWLGPTRVQTLHLSLSVVGAKPVCIAAVLVGFSVYAQLLYGVTAVFSFSEKVDPSHTQYAVLMFSPGF
jgi:hypothetical protein